MNLLKAFVEDMKAVMPVSVKYYDNKETGEVAFEIVNKPNRFVPTHVRSYENKKISIYEATNEKPQFVQEILRRNQKCLTTRKEPILVGNSY